MCIHIDYKWGRVKTSTVVCRWMYLLYMIPWVLFRQGHSCRHTLIISCGPWERQGQPTQSPPAPPFSITVPQPWPPRGNMPDCYAATDSMCPWIYDGDLLAAFHVKSHLEFPSLAVCVASVNPLTFRADTYRAWALTVFQPLLTTTFSCLCS